MNRNINAKWGKIKMISSFALFTSAFLALIAGINAANPKWTPCYTSALFAPKDGSSTNLQPDLFREGSTTVYDPNSNEIILFGGFLANPGMRNLRLNDVWVLTNANNSGTTPCPSNPASTKPCWTNVIKNGLTTSPEIRYNHSAVYDKDSNRMIIYGGCVRGCLPIADDPFGNTTSPDFWVLSNANGVGGTPTWTKFSPTGAAPGARQGHQAVYDSSTNSMIVWAGTDGTGPACGIHAYSDVWVLSNANGLGGTPPKWTKLQLSPRSAGPPAGRSLSTAVYDSANNIMIVFGGAGLVPVKGGTNCQSTNAVWALSNANGSRSGRTPTWKNLVPESSPPPPPEAPSPREAHVAVYGPGNTMTIFGGYFSDHKSPRTLLDDTWALSNANGSSTGGTPTWKNLTDPNGANPVPSSRWNGGVIDAANNIIMFGGSSSEGPLWSTWVLPPPPNGP